MTGKLGRGGARGPRTQVVRGELQLVAVIRQLERRGCARGGWEGVSISSARFDGSSGRTHDAGIADEDVQSIVLGFEGLCKRHHRLERRQVQGYVMHLGTRYRRKDGSASLRGAATRERQPHADMRPRLQAHFVRALRATAGKDHGAAVCRQLFGRDQPNAPIGSCDNGDFSGQIWNVLSLEAGAAVHAPNVGRHCHRDGSDNVRALAPEHDMVSTQRAPWSCDAYMVQPYIAAAGFNFCAAALAVEARLRDPGHDSQARPIKFEASQWGNGKVACQPIAGDCRLSGLSIWTISDLPAAAAHLGKPEGKWRTSLPAQKVVRKRMEQRLQSRH